MKMKVIVLLKKIATYAIIGAVAIAQFIPWMAIGYVMGKSDTLEKKANK